jgi:hemoglobin
MPRIELCDEQDVTRLVHDFYARVRHDATLGPFFDAHVVDWDHHLAKMVDFWSSTLRGTARYRGTPMPKRTALPGLDARMFERWLLLFRETTAALDNPALRERADDLAARIAQSLWYGYQMSRDPDRIPKEHSFG